MTLQENKVGDSILYELLVYSEWIQEPEILLKLMKPESKLLRLATRPWTLKYLLPYSRGETVNDKIRRMVSARSPWQLAVGEDGKVVAIIQDTILEIRTARDEYSSVVGRASISRDHFPQYRKAVWSPDCSLLACAFSSGRIGLYDLLGSNILNIEPRNQQPEEWPNTEEAIAGIFFLEDRVKSPKWSYELIAVDYKGNLKSFLVSPTEGFREHHTFSFASHYRNGVSALHITQHGNLLILAGPCDVELEQKGRGSSAGLSAWRILSDHPFYSPALSSEDDLLSIQRSHGFWNWMQFFASRTQSDVLSMKVSPAGRILACMHASGAVSLWQLPSLRLFKYWQLSEQPDHNARNPQLIEGHTSKLFSSTGQNTSSETAFDFLPVDISWWSENVLIIARYSGAVSVCSTVDLHNMLGEFPEFFAGPPQVSAASCDGRGFLSLECEVNVSSKQSNVGDLMDQTDEASSADEAEPEDSFIRRNTSTIRTVLYWVTDSERFRPPRPRPRILKRTYRLIGLKSTTPEELYARKINNEEYGEALQLARTYGLDCDLVYQRQWRSQKVSITTIHDYLSKIKKYSWVLQECTQRVPETAAAARGLLLFGLQATNLQTLLSLNLVTSELWQPESEDDIEINKHEISNIVMQLKDLQLTMEQQELLQCRCKLLKYLDMLRTYELILGEGSSSNEELYDASFYSRFRSQSLFSSAIEFARDGQWQAVSCMLTYHSKQLLTYRLPIISSFPETMEPFQYRSLLPECEDDSVVPWPVEDLRDEDWCEELNLSEDAGNEAVCCFLNKEEDWLLEYCSETLTTEQLCKWYLARATQLENISRIVDHALSLLMLGQERSVQGLDILLSELLTLEVLVYEVQIDNLSLATLRQHNHLSQARLLMSKSNAEVFVDHARRWLLPYLLRCEKITPGSREQLLHDFLVNLSQISLALPLEIFKQLKIEQPCAFFTSMEEAISVALDCLYAYPETDQLHLAFQILECLPEKGFGEKNRVILELHYRVDQLEGHLAAAEILGKYTELGVPLYKLRLMAEDEQASLRTLIQIARSMTKRVPPPKQSSWSELLKDMLTLQAKVFSCVLIEKCFEIYAETLLASGSRTNIRYAGTIMECSKMEIQDGQQKIVYDASVRLVLSASREYFDSSCSFADPGMDLAKACLLLISDDHTEIKEELDLIAALQLLGNFGVKLLPIQVRLCLDKQRLLRDCLKNKSTSYRNTQRLLQLATFLRVKGDDIRAREAVVLVLVAEAALQAKDYVFCAETCMKMMDKSHSVGWQVAQQLVECEDYNDIETRHCLLGFAILHCEVAAIEQLVTYRCKLESQVLHKKISIHLPVGASNSMFPSSPSIDEFSDALSSPEVESRAFPSILPQKLPELLQQSTEALRDTTRNILLNVSNETFWNTAFHWMPQPRKDPSSVTDHILTQGFHTFYMSLHNSNCHESSLGPHYDSFANSTCSDPSLELLLHLVRVSLLEEFEESEDVILTDEVILKAGQGLLIEDCHIGLCLLLALKDITQAKELFLQLPRSLVSLQMAAYYFALVTCIDELPQNERHIAFFYDPHKLIKLVHCGHISDNANTERSMESRKLLASFLSLQSEFLLSLQLQNLDCGVDSLRFSHDEQYRQDSILGLAMTDDEEQFELAQSLAEKYNVSSSHLAVARLSHLLIDANYSKEKILSVVEELEQYFDDTLFTKMEDEVLPNIEGTDHKRLLCFFLVLQKVSDETVILNLPPSQHVKLLMKINSTLPGIDYKILISQPTEVFKMLQLILTQENINIIVKLLEVLPPNIRCCIHPGMIYKMWIRKLFFEENCDTSEKHWKIKLELCREYLNKLNVDDLTDLASDLAFSEEAFKCISLPLRLSILKEFLQFCRSRQQIEEWGEIAGQLQKWTSHLSAFEEKTTILSSSKCKEFAKQLQLSKGEYCTVMNIREEIIKSNVPLSTVVYLFSLQPSSYAPLPQYLIVKLQEAKEQGRMDFISWVLKRLSELYHEQPELAKDLRILKEQLSPLGADSNLEPASRLQALRLMQLITPEQGEDVTDAAIRRAVYMTEAILASVWPNNTSIETSNLTDFESRNNLFNTLLECSQSSQEQLLALSELLQAWQQARLDCSHLWIQLVEVMAQDESNADLFQLLQDVFKTSSLETEVMLQLLKPLKNLRQKIVLCLMSLDEPLHSQAITFLQEMEKDMLHVILDSELLELIVLRKLVAQVVPTPAYPHLIAFLLQDQEENLKSALQQLVKAGLQAEAATLYSSSIGLPASLASFSTVLGIFSIYDYN